MINVFLPVIAVLAGISCSRFFRQSKITSLKLFLAFTGAFLLSVTVLELLPSVYKNMDPNYTGLFIMGGILLQIILEFFSKGAEHGHLHNSSDRLRFPWLLFISLSIHAFLEGFPIANFDSVAYGVIIHKIPIAILLTSYLINSNLSKLNQFLFLLVFTLMTPLGALTSILFTIEEVYIHCINALVVGMFFHISTIILFESGEEHQFNLNKIVVMLTAVVLAFFM